ncbi:hypothetical protein K491DRAFT_665038 [Lophiostoma macrostomum CBS 122681]|uniref:N-acetyltransferase domain-containing protein n=1 Tax=Lophiostoma macrostomum CBS 122681 TaxID=1314788 RepID=A0A6A6SVI6_9PLEO|nr:hypothetical protein K491DRAFT_665038 [Lophiostoma macrostomum CBS 122681]
MPLTVRPVTHADVEQCIAIRIATLGSLVIGRPPPYPGYIEYSIASLHDDLDKSESESESHNHVHHLKVINAASEREEKEGEEEVLAYAKWEIYAHGRPDLEALREGRERREKASKEFDVDAYGALREAAHECFCRCNAEMGRRGHIPLLATSEKHRRLGAASLLVQWGIEKSEAMGLPCYLQASEQGRRLYQHYGFEIVSSVEFELERYGLQGVERMTAMLRYPCIADAKERIEA